MTETFSSKQQKETLVIGMTSLSHAQEILAFHQSAPTSFLFPRDLDYFKSLIATNALFDVRVKTTGVR